MFYLQVQDLKVASPATVSRCGMVYIDPEELKWMPYVQTWIAGLPSKVGAWSALSTCSDVIDYKYIQALQNAG